MAQRDFDVIIFGATGYTGEHISRELHALASKGGSWQGVAWAIGGRSEPKLSAMAAKHGLTPAGVVIADTSDAASLRSMTARAKVVMNATGPYRFYGEAVVEACIATKTDYVDLCGEPEFIDRCLLKHADTAEAAGVLIVHACAFDSVPADIGCLYTALQYPPPALCAHADMYHTFDVAADAEGAAAHATTFYAAVHGFGGVGATRAQRKALVEKLETDSAGSSKGPPPLGPKLRVKPGPTYKKELGKYAFLFPGADSAVVRASQRALLHGRSKRPAAAKAAALEPYLTPQFGASFCVSTRYYAAATAAVGLLFGLLARRAWGRALLLRHPGLFSLGLFSDAGPTDAFLSKAQFSAVFLSRGWSNAGRADAPQSADGAGGAGGAGGFDRFVRTSVSGPEPGYIGTSKMFSAMARYVLEDRAMLGVTGGVFTPGGLAGSGGPAAITRLVSRLDAVGITFRVDEERAIVPRGGEGGEGGGGAAAAARRPAWQSALNAVALVGWCVAFAMVLAQWPHVSAEPSTTLMRLTMCIEMICVFEVCQIAIGAARGNLILGFVLHYTRVAIALVVFPIVPTHLASRLILLAWTTTEICRYPMFLAPSSRAARLIRFVTPVVTFPLGAGAEAWAAYLSLGALATRPVWLRVAIALIVPTNVIGGTLWAMPGLVKKARHTLRKGGKAA